MKPRILFVDDEPHVLAGLRRSLRSVKDEWEMVFTEEAETVLEILKLQPFDVIVSDMQMPGMSGAELLEKVRELHPQTIRIVLSGQYDQSTAYNLVEGEHRYLAKPCDRNLLIDTITSALQAQRDFSSEEIEPDTTDKLAADFESLTNYLYESGAIASVEIPLPVRNEVTKRAIEAVGPIMGEGIDIDAEDEMASFLRFDFSSLEEDDPTEH